MLVFPSGPSHMTFPLHRAVSTAWRSDSPFQGQSQEPLLLNAFPDPGKSREEDGLLPMWPLVLCWLPCLAGQQPKEWLLNG